jgi:hypothetical protein
VGYVCGDVRHDALTDVWEKYRAAWRNEAVVAAIRSGIAGHLAHADANMWQSIPNGVEKCST